MHHAPAVQVLQREGDVERDVEAAAASAGLELRMPPDLELHEEGHEWRLRHDQQPAAIEGHLGRAPGRQQGARDVLERRDRTGGRRPTGPAPPREASPWRCLAARCVPRGPSGALRSRASRRREHIPFEGSDLETGLEGAADGVTKRASKEAALPFDARAS